MVTHCSICAQPSGIGKRWILSDEGHTLKRLTYEIDARDLIRGNRQKLIESALKSFGVSNAEGELYIPVLNGSYGDALFNFVQSLLKISDVTFLRRERIKSTLRGFSPSTGGECP